MCVHTSRHTGVCVCLVLMCSMYFIVYVSTGIMCAHAQSEPQMMRPQMPQMVMEHLHGAHDLCVCVCVSVCLCVCVQVGQAEAGSSARARRRLYARDLKSLRAQSVFMIYQ